MTRVGAEPKPAWRTLPLPVRQQVEEILGARISRATIAWGGYGPTPTFRLMLSDGRRAFFKGTNEDSNEFSRDALEQEARVYADVAPLIAEFMPALFGHFRHNDWHVFLLEDVGPKSAPPWTRATLQAVVYGMVDFHRATVDKSLPGWIRRIENEASTLTWAQIVANSANLAHMTVLFGARQVEAKAWLDSASALFVSNMAGMVAASDSRVLLHGDFRSDNLRLFNNRLRLFDWPWVTVGFAEWELVPFAQCVAVEGGAMPEQVIALYNEHSAVNEAAVSTSIVWWSAFFLDRFWQPAIPGLPRLRRFQYEQARVLLHWMARHFSLPTPDWLSAISL